MKFLIPQKIRFRTKEGLVKIKPGCPGIIKLANKLKIIKETIKIYEGEYYITEGYIVSRQDFYWLKLLYKCILNEKRKRFYQQEPLIQLIKILKYIFKRNNRAKQNQKFSSINKAYDDKALFLEMALRIAKVIEYAFFSYGFQEDQNESYHDIIYYFEIKDVDQVSFHSEKLYSDIPEFSGEWTHKINEKYPFNLNTIKKLIKISN